MLNLFSGKAFLLYLLASIFICTAVTRVPANDITLTGALDSPHQDNTISTVGDLNGDGIADLVISGFMNGKLYVVWGPLTNISSLDVTTMTSDRGFIISEDNQNGMAVKNAGDFNDDGIDDLIIGVPSSSPLSRNAAGKAYVIFGKRSAFSDFNLASLRNDQGFQIFGEAANDLVGYSVSHAGDFNNDGVDDIIVGGPTDPAQKHDLGHTYVIFGKTTGFSDIDLAALTIDQGIRITGEAAADRLGYSVSNAGDFNNDGIDDVIIGAISDSTVGIDAGCAYVILGKEEGLDHINLASIATTDGIRITAETAHDLVGSAVSYAGDFNNDTIDDVIIGAPGASKAYVLFGKSTGLFHTSLSTLVPSEGFQIIGVAGDKFGAAVSYAWDMNGDSIDDVIIGAPKTNKINPAPLANLTSAGAICVVYGQKTTGASVSWSDIVANYDLGFVSQGDTNNAYFGRSVGYAGNIDGISAHSVVARGSQADFRGLARILTGDSYYIYWDYSRLASCQYPLQTDIHYGLTFCMHPCSDDPENPYLYWDGSCQSSCEFPLSSRVFKGKYFCDFPCLKREFLYDDKTCSDTCTLPIIEEITGSRKLCKAELPMEVQEVSASVIVVKDTSMVNKIVQIMFSLISFGNPSMAITSIMLKSLFYARYLDIRDTADLKMLYNNLDSAPDCVDIAPKMPGNIKDNSNYTQLSFEFSRYDMRASFLMSYWIAFISISILFALCVFLLILNIALPKSLRRPKIQGFISHLRIILQNFTIQQFYCTFPDIVLSTIFEFQGQISGSFSFIHTAIVITWWLIALGLLTFHFIVIYRYKKLRKSAENKEENKQILRDFMLKYAGFTLLFKEFQDGSIITQAFFLIFIFRAIAFASVIGLLYEYPLVQISILIALGILMLAILLRNKPHRKNIDLLQHILLEILVLLVILFMFILTLQDLAGTQTNQIQYKLGKGILACNIISRFVPLLCMLARFVLVIYYRNKSGRNWHLQTLLNEVLDSFNPNKKSQENDSAIEISPEKKPLKIRIIEEKQNTPKGRKLSKVVSILDEDVSIQFPTPLKSEVVLKSQGSGSSVATLTGLSASQIDKKMLLRSKIAIQVKSMFSNGEDQGSLQL